MVKNKKMSKSAIAIIVLALLLVLSMVMGLTGAWFTDSKLNKGTSSPLNFGEISIDLTEGAYTFTGTVSDGVHLMPGDTIAAGGEVSNSHDACFVRYIMVVNFTPAAEHELTAADKTALDGAFTSAHYEVVTSGAQWKVELAEGDKISLANGESTPTTHAVGADVTIPVVLSDAAENGQISVSLNVYAIQQDNYAESAWATAFPSVYGA